MSGAATSKGEGHGTGLFLVKSVVDAYGGEIRVESTQGVGSSFIITFRPPPAGGHLRERSFMYTVVIVEDDPMITELNRRYAEKDGRFTVTQTFSQPRRALDWLRHNPADLVILDSTCPR